MSREVVQFFLREEIYELPFVADFRLQGQLDALSTKDFETLKGLKREINTRFRKWSLVNDRDAVVFNTVRDMKAEIFKQIELQEQKRWTLNLVKGSQEQKARSASKLASACRRKLLQDRFIHQTEKNQALVRLTTRIVRSFAESSEATAKAFSDLRNFGLDDSTPLSRVLDNDLIVSVLACGLENMLFQILAKLGGGRTMHEGLKGTPNNQILASIETYGRIISTIKAKEFQLDNFHQQCQALDKQIKELQTRNEDLCLILQGTTGDLAAVTSAHFDVLSKLRLKEEVLSKIKECFPTQNRGSETDLLCRIKAFFLFKVPKLEAECHGLRREKDEIRRKLESKLREVHDEKIREMDTMKSRHESQIQEHEDIIKQLQQCLDDQASAANVKLHVKHTEAVFGGNEAAQVALLAVILDRMGSSGARVERIVSALRVGTGKKMKDEEVCPSMLCRPGLIVLTHFALFQVLALLRRHTTVFMSLVSPADHWAYRLARGLQSIRSIVAAASAPEPRKTC